MCRICVVRHLTQPPQLADPKASFGSPSGKFERLFPPSSFVIAPLRPQLGGGGISCKKRREVVSAK